MGGEGLVYLVSGGQAFPGAEERETDLDARVGVEVEIKERFQPATVDANFEPLQPPRLRFARFAKPFNWH